MFFKYFYGLVAALALVCLGAVPGRAAEAPDTISEITVSGNSTVSSADILSWLKVRVGDRLDEVASVIDRDLKDLWDTGKFADVAMVEIPLGEHNLRLEVRVKERPLLASLKITGNRAFPEKELLQKIDLKPGSPYSAYSLDAAARKIRDFYTEKEYFQAKVEPRAEITGDQADVTFHVDEGLKVKVTKIEITGNQAFSEGKVQGFMETKAAGWFIGGTYKEETFRTDLKKILLGYAKEGYLKAKIDGYGLQDIDGHFSEISGQALVVDPEKKQMTIRLQIEEGRQYVLGKIVLKGNIIFSEEELLGRTQLKPGAIFDRIAFEMDLQKIRMAYAEKGYIFADVSQEMEYHDDTGKVDVVIWVKENTIARIEKIEIRGNTTTKDKVIRRELTVEPGEPFDSREIQRSQEKIMNLGFFEDIKVTTEPGSTPGEQVLVFDIKERHTGTISLGAGYSSVDYLMGYLQLTQANLFGNGQSVSLQWEMGQLRQSYQMSFTEPWLFDAPVSFGVDIWNINKQRGYGGQMYNLLSQGGDLRLGKRFNDYWRGFLTYKLESDEYSDLDSSLNAYYSEGRNDTSSLTPTLIYDTRDNIFDATQGTYERLAVDMAGGPLGGDNNYLRYDLDASYFLPLIWRLVLALHGEAGYAHGYGYGVNGFTTVPLAKRYRVGGTDTVRGYTEGEFGPAEGGLFKLVSNVEIHFPIVGPLKGVAFFDAGNTWGVAGDNQTERANREKDIGAAWDNFLLYPHLYKGAGLGIRLTVPGTVILIRFDFGYPLDSRPGGKSQSLNYHFNIGNIF